MRKMNKGIVMEIQPRKIIVMTREGAFESIPRSGRHCVVGEEIEYRNAATVPHMWRYASAAAAVILFIVTLSLWGPLGSLGGPGGAKAVAAYVSVDINPSIELAIDEDEIVLEAKGLNRDGQRVLAEVEYEGRSVEEVATLLLEEADEQGYLDRYLAEDAGTVVIATTLVEEEGNASAQLETDIQTKVTAAVEQSLNERHPEAAEAFAVQSLSAPKELRDEAEKQGISVGKAAIQYVAEKQGVHLTQEQLQTESVHDLTKQYGGLGQLLQVLDVDPSSKELKSDIKLWLKDAKAKGKEAKQADQDKGKDKSDDGGEDEEKPGDDKGNGNGNGNGKGSGKGNGKGHSSGTPSPIAEPIITDVLEELPLESVVPGPGGQSGNQGKDKDKDKNKDKDESNGKDKDHERDNGKGKGKQNDKDKEQDRDNGSRGNDSSESQDEGDSVIGPMPTVDIPELLPGVPPLSDVLPHSPGNGKDEPGKGSSGNGQGKNGNGQPKHEDESSPKEDERRK